MSRPILFLCLALLCQPACGGGRPSRSAGGADPQPLGRDQSRTVESIHIRDADQGLAAGGFEVEDLTGRCGTERGIWIEAEHADASGSWRRFLSCRGSVAVSALATAPDSRRLAVGWFSGSLGPTSSDGETMHAVGLAELFLVSHDQAGERLWMAGSRAVDDKSYAVGQLAAVTPDGAWLVAGGLKGTVAFGRGAGSETTLQSDAHEVGFLARYDRDGCLGWAQLLPGALDPQRGALLACSREGEILVAGRSAEHGQEGSPPHRAMFLARLAANGALRWVFHTGGAGSIAPEAGLLLPSGASVITGSYLGPIHMDDLVDLASGGQARKMFVLCHDPGGELRWCRTLGGGSDSWAMGSAIVLGEDGRLEVRGSFSGTVGVDEMDPVYALQSPLDDEVSLRLQMDLDGRVLSLSSPANAEVDGLPVRGR